MRMIKVLTLSRYIEPICQARCVPAGALMAAFPAPSSLFPTIAHKKKRALLLAYAETGQLRRSCRAVTVDHSQHYYWLDTDPDYVAAFAQAERIAAFTLEEEAIRRARDGVRR